MRSWVFYIVFVFSTLPAWCQVEVEVKGDQEGDPVGDVLVYAIHNGKVVASEITDSKGFVRLVVNEFPVSLQASHLNYEPAVVEVSTAGRVSLRIHQKENMLADVVVTGQYEPVSARQSVYRVRTLSSERIQSQGATRLQDVLSNELNIRFNQDLATGGSNLSLQGLNGQNVKVLIDGLPIIGRQGVSNEININQINVNAIDRVEIVEGPMSVIYGADALAGVINIITKKEGTAAFDAGVNVQEETVGNEYGIDEGIHNESIYAGYRLNEKWYARADFGRNAFGGWTGDSTGREKTWHPKRQWLGSGLLQFTTGQWKVHYRLDFLDEKVKDRANFSGNEALDRNYLTKRLMHQLQGEVVINPRLNFSGGFSFSDFRRRTQAITVNRLTGAEHLALSGQLYETFTGGTARGVFTYKLPSISFQTGYDINVEQGGGDRIKEGQHFIGDYALFFSSEIGMGKIKVRPGLRFLHNSVYQAPPVVFSANAKYDISDRTNVRLSYGRGFRAPSLRELYFTFFDASHSIEGNPDLEAELSHSINGDLAVDLVKSEQVSWNANVSGFYNLVDNKIVYGQSSVNTTTYVNVGQFKSVGFSLRQSVRWKGLQGTVGFMRIGQYNEYFESDNQLPEFVYSNEFNASIQQHFSRLGLDLNVFWKLTGKTPFYEIAEVDEEEIVRLARTDSYQWLDIILRKKVLDNLFVGGGVRNMLDNVFINTTTLTSGVHASGPSRPVGYGRSWFLNVSYSISK